MRGDLQRAMRLEGSDLEKLESTLTATIHLMANGLVLMPKCFI